MGNIYVGFSRPREFKIGAEAIAWWIGAPYSHVYLRFAYDGSKDVVFHAAHGMVHFKSIDNFKKQNNVIKEFDFKTSQKQHDELFDLCMDLSGEPYSKIQLLRIFISELCFKVFNKNIDFTDGRGYICSELVGTVINNLIELKFNKPIHMLNPRDIDEALTNG